MMRPVQLLFLGICFEACHSLWGASTRNVQAQSHMCPDKEGTCPDKSTCCQRLDGKYGCCPLPNAVCCSDKVHCCPQGFTCDVAAGTCSKGSLVIDWLQPMNKDPVKKPSIGLKKEKKQRNTCPDGGSCSSDATCCKIDGRGFGCCAHQEAVCCADKQHCCPKGYRCGEDMCISETSDQSAISWTNLALGSRGDDRKTESSVSVRSVVCPGGQFYCPTGDTCCQGKTGQWSLCCPGVQAVCCSDHLHCCPHGYTCDVTRLQCIPNLATLADKTLRFVPMETQRDASAVDVATVNNINEEHECPDKISTCPDKTTCCEMKDGYYGCCQYENAVCCSDMLHCCPHDMQCNSTTGECVNALYRLPYGRPETEKVQRVEDVKQIVCPDKSTCPEQTTCCEQPDKKYGCCPYPNAHCCADHLHCCPSDQTCDSEKGECVSSDQVTRQPLGVKFASTPPPRILSEESASFQDAICPGGKSKCAGQSTCCEIGPQQYGCCNLPNAVCCADKLHCCPAGYKCNDKQGACDGDSDSIPWQQHQVTSGQEKTVPSTALSTVTTVPCPDGKTVCPDGATCCAMATGGYGCCPVPNAVCCSDHIHCCPQGSKCNVKAQKCEKQDSEPVPWFRKRPALQMQVKTLHDVNCPDNTTCAAGNTCCKTLTGGYGCCPLESAVCCSDEIHCCPHGSTCDVASGTCLSKDIQSLKISWTSMQNKRRLAQNFGSVICPDGSTSCATGQTCCKLNGGDYGCCPLPSAVCCPDSDYCCPNGMRCEVSTHMCLTNLEESDTQIPFMMLQKQANTLSGVSDVVCPDHKVSCHHDQTCCKLSSGDYGCCPLPAAVCCSDGTHCCPHGMTCNPTSGTCTSMATPTKSVVKLESVICPDQKHSCPHDSTCCKVGSSYGCCPLPAATCCSDGIHCCPHGYTCDAGSCTQNENSLTVSWTYLERRKIQETSDLTSGGLVGANKCPDATECPWGTTCCQSSTGKYACCSQKNATCCADKIHCCPAGYTCSSEPGKCEKPGVKVTKPGIKVTDSTQTRIPWFKKVPANPLPGVVSDLSPRCHCDRHETCCQVGEGFGCCPMSQAQCCADQKTCCPHGYQCSTRGMCVKK